MTEKEKMIAGEYYLANDPILAAERKHCKQLLKQLNVDHFVTGEETDQLLAKL
ncbi:MAG: sugar O-acetyltransferase, partial [Mucilaginibacter sp.]